MAAMLSLFLRLVIRRIAHREHAVPARNDMLAELRQPRSAAGDGASERICARIAGSCMRLMRSADRQLQQRLVARPDGERIQCGIDAQHHADRTAGDLRSDLGALRARPCTPSISRRQRTLSVGRSVSRNQTGRPVSLPKLRHPLQLFGFIVEIAVHAECAVAQALEARSRCRAAPALRSNAPAPSRRSVSCASWCARW